jgi:hypothetical protein
MSQQIQMRRDTNAARLTVTLASGEPFWCTDTLEMYVGDGVTPGGRKVYGQTGVRWEGAITGLTGGGATSVDGIATVDLAANSVLLLVRVDGFVKGFVLIESNDAEDVAAGKIRPDDHDDVTNPKLWLQVF